VLALSLESLSVLPHALDPEPEPAPMKQQRS